MNINPHEIETGKIGTLSHPIVKSQCKYLVAFLVSVPTYTVSREMFVFAVSATACLCPDPGDRGSG
jgi:hypothetical protein